MKTSLARGIPAVPFSGLVKVCLTKYFCKIISFPSPSLCVVLSCFCVLCWTFFVTCTETVFVCCVEVFLYVVLNCFCVSCWTVFVCCAELFLCVVLMYMCKLCWTVFVFHAELFLLILLIFNMGKIMKNTGYDEDWFSDCWIWDQRN